MFRNMTITLTIRTGYVDSPDAFTTVSAGQTLSDVVQAAENSIGAERALRGKVKSMPDCFVISVKGMDRRLQLAAEHGISQLIDYDETDSLAEVEHMLRFIPLVNAMEKAVEEKECPDIRVLQALETQEFQRICGFMKIPILPVAELLRGNTQEILNGWRGLLFSEPPVSFIDAGDVDRMNAILGKLYIAGNDILIDPDRFRADGGACGLWASVLNRVLETGGHYIVVDGPEFDSATSYGCSHIAVRVGNFAVDGRGVHTLSEFMHKWGGEWSNIHEIHEPDDEGVIEVMRECRLARKLLDENKLENALREAGLTPDILKPITTNCNGL